MNRFLLLAVLTCLGTVALAQQQRYVTDSLRLEARTGPSTDHRIITMLRSGTEVRVTEETEGWSHVELPDGGDAWMLTRFLMAEPPARRELSRLVTDLGAVRDRNTLLEDELGKLRAATQAAGREEASLQRANQQLAQELAELRRTASGAIALRDENELLRERSQQLQRQHDQLEKSNVVLQASRERDWFIAGAAVLLCGMALGLIIPKIRWKRRRSWSEL